MVPSAPITGYASTLSAGNAHFSWPGLELVLNWLNPLCKGSCWNIGHGGGRGAYALTKVSMSTVPQPVTKSKPGPAEYPVTVSSSAAIQAAPGAGLTVQSM